MTKESTVSVAALADILKNDTIYSDPSLVSEVTTLAMADLPVKERGLFQPDQLQNKLALLVAGAERVLCALRHVPYSFKDDFDDEQQYEARCQRDKQAILSHLEIKKSELEIFFDRYTLPYPSTLFPNMADHTDAVVQILPGTTDGWTTQISLDEVRKIFITLRNNNKNVMTASNKTSTCGPKKKLSDDECIRIYIYHYTGNNGATVPIREIALKYPWDKTSFEPVPLYKTNTRKVSDVLLSRIKSAIRRGRDLTPISERPINDKQRLMK